MDWKKMHETESWMSKAMEVFAGQKSTKRLDGWFLVKEIQTRHWNAFDTLHPEMKAARLLERVVEELPLSIGESAVFAGRQNDAFARSYALINPTFKVEEFEGYCDPVAVFKDIEPNEEFTEERIAAVRSAFEKTPYVQDLKKVYTGCASDTKEVAYFVEQVTGHTIADFRPILADGVEAVVKKIKIRIKAERDDDKIQCLKGMCVALEASVALAARYAAIAEQLSESASGSRKRELALIADTLRRVPRKGARNLFEAIQSFIILWQTMCLEQAPNPYAFSVGNVDRIFEPYRAAEGCGRKEAAALIAHLLAFLNVGDRSWAISQNLMVGGKSSDGTDLTNEMTFAVLDAFFACNFPQPILSVKLHRGTPDDLHKALGKFLFTPGRLTPSLFNDDSVFETLSLGGVATEDLEDYSIAGCQEPLIMGKDNGNTTNSWLNLAKILELTLNDGRSTITGDKIGLGFSELRLPAEKPEEILRGARTAFHRQLDHFLSRMADSANGCSWALANLRVPFLSATMGCVETGVDFRDPTRQGTKYNGSGCLVHGLSVVSDSFVAIDNLLKDRPQDAARLLEALRNDFAGAEDLRQFLASAPKYGNNARMADYETSRLTADVSLKVASLRNYLGNPFRPDFSSPSTHLLYGRWVGATADGRRARQMLGYGIDPLFGEASSGLGFRTLSLQKLPFDKMRGGYASHFGVDPKYFPEKAFEEKGIAFKNRIIEPLFFPKQAGANPFYLYVNVTTAETLRKVLANPAKYAPNGVYIMRIHGTFVNFLDLSPAIQNDIILRLDPASTQMGTEEMSSTP